MKHRIASHTAAPDFSLDVLVDDNRNTSGSSPAFRGIGPFVMASFGSDHFGFDLRRRRVAGVVSGQTANDGNFWNNVLLPIAVGVMGCAIGVVPMHCACLEWNREGILVAGLSGAGKSTLAAAMGHYGFAFLSDDWTYISSADGRLTAHGLGVPLKLLPDADRFFDALQRYRTHSAMNGELAFEVDPVELGFRTKSFTYPTRLLLLERNESGPPKFSPVESGLVKDFFERSSERLPTELGNMRQMRSRVIDDVARLECWNFSYSGSPHHAAKAVREFLERSR
jgi:hypothetical protein